MGFGNGGGESTSVLSAGAACKGPWSGMCNPKFEAVLDKATAEADPEKQQAAFEAVTDLMKELVTHKIFFKIHGVIGYSNRLDFTARHDETLFPWEIVVK
jgi:ABC-type transport system substrate-binding protein